MTRLLMTVRSIAEASTCFHNGADLIDIRDGSRGSTRMASPETIRAILREVPPRFPVSAMLGEWLDWRKEGRFPSVPAGVAYLRVGLAGAAELEGWREEFGRFAREVLARAEVYSEPGWVATAYVDWKAARSPRPEEVLDFASANGFAIFFLDTRGKDGSGLFDHAEPSHLARLVEMAHARGLQVALSGSPRPEDIERMLALGPEILAVRAVPESGSGCGGTIDGETVRFIAGAAFESLQLSSNG